MSEIKQFEPKFMPIGVLTAALQELTPRERRDPDPDLAIEEWLDFAVTLDADCIELSAALHPSLADVPAEAMLDPVANTLDLREPFDDVRAKRVLAAIDATGVAIADIGYFDDMLHEDPAIRRKKHDFMIAVMNAATLLGVPAVTGFVGRNQSKSMDQNLIDFEESFVPLLKEAKARGLQYRVEQCPMPGWTPGDNFHNNIGYAPGMWIALHQIAERNGVGDQFRIHYDPSHAILMGQDTRSIFQYLKDAGYGFLIAGMHVKGPGDPLRGRRRMGIRRPDGAARRLGRRRDVDATQPISATRGRSRRCCASTNFPAPPATIRSPTCRTAPSIGSIISSRRASCSTSIRLTTPLIVEHEYGAARVQDKALLQPILAASMAFTRHIDRAAASMYALQAEVLAAQGIPVQGVGREAYRS